MATGANARPEPLKPETLDEAYGHIQRGFDRTHGGWGDAPKFPQPMLLEFLLRHHHTTGDAQALQMITQTLDAMARGGMYDQIGGGFHRYSVDNHWTVPHFEKMLYDAAQLARVYLHTWQVTGNPFYRTIVEETLDYVIRKMLDPSGGFYSTQDADSEGEEGKFFLWTAEEIRALLGDEANRFIEVYGVTKQGNFEGKTILELKGSLKERQDLVNARHKLFEAREKRPHPERDDKILTSWNGLMLAAFAEAARVLGRADYRQIAEHNAEFLLTELKTTKGRLYHTWQNNVAKINGYLEDYTHLIEGLVELYQTTFNPHWYLAAKELADAMVDHFSAPDGSFYDTSDDHETLITRPRELQDNAVPSGNAMAALTLQRLAGLSLEPSYAEIAQQNLCAMQPLLSKYPLGFAQWLIALSYDLERPREIAIVSNLANVNTRALLDVCTNRYRPYQIIAVGTSTADIPLLQGRRQLESQPTAYVCTDFTCQSPVTEPDALLQLIEAPLADQRQIV
jgi:uncharacterized protein YyaL (SSP411 family)